MPRDEDDDNDLSGWALHAGTILFEKALRKRLNDKLIELVAAGQASTDPKVSAVTAEYLEGKTALGVLLVIARGKDAKVKDLP